MQGTRHCQGALADQCNEDGTQDSGTCKSAFAPEAMAILRGLIIALTCPFPVRMHYDCESAAACVLGSASSDHPIIHAAVHVLQILKSQQRSVYFWHEKSHSGVALNEMADCWAKLAAKGIGCAPHGDLAPSFVQDGLLNWLWLSMRETQTECQWPYIDDLTGAFTYQGCQKTDWSGQRALFLEASKPASVAIDRQERFALRILTYNTTTMLGKTQQEAVETMAVKNNCHILGLQEARGRLNEVNDSEHYRKFCSAREKGHLGCQLWISKQSRWNLESIVVRHRDPRLICIVGKLSGVNCAAIAAHAPHSGSEDHVIDEWWQRFAAFLTELPHSASPIICIDANARFRTGLQRDREPANRNAFHMHRILEQFHLEASAPFDNQ